ncbi:MAG: nucleotide exchange factor GrpE [Clostridia bacterium]
MKFTDSQYFIYKILINKVFFVKKRPKKVDEWQQKYNSLNEEYEQNKNFTLRLQADFENFKKRNKSISADMYSEGKFDVIQALFPVLDSFDRAEKIVVSEKEQEGILLVKRQFEEILNKLGVKEIPAINQVFNPNLHNAVMKCEDAENSGKVVEVFQKGYQLGDKILRYAMVKVAD